MSAFLKTVCATMAAAMMLCPISVHAQRRAPQFVIETARTKMPLDSLLQAPARNFRKIKALWLNPASGDFETAGEEFEKAIGRTEGAEDKAAIHLLLAEAERGIRLRKAMGKMRQEKEIEAKRISPAVMQELFGDTEKDGSELSGHPLLLALLSDFASLPEKTEAPHLRDDMIAYLNAFLAEARPEDLPDEVRAAIVEKYVESRWRPLESCPPEKAVSIYRHLGMEAELERTLAKNAEEVKEMKELIRYMRMAEKAGMKTRAVAFADELLARLAGMPEADAEQCIYDMADDCARLAPEAALAKLRKYTEKFPRVYVSLYKASCLVGKHGDAEQRCREWLLPWLEKLQADRNPNTRRLMMTNISMVLHEFEMSGDFDGAIYVADFILSMEDQKGGRSYWNAMYRKGRCQWKAGRLDDAKATFENCLGNEELDADIRYSITKELERISNQMNKGERDE